MRSKRNKLKCLTPLLTPTTKTHTTLLNQMINTSPHLVNLPALRHSRDVHRSVGANELSKSEKSKDNQPMHNEDRDF